MRLYGNDMDDTTTVVEADLGWIVGWKKTGFLGFDVLKRQKAEGAPRKLVGFEMLDRAIARQGYEVYIDGAESRCRHERNADAISEESDRNGVRALGSRRGRHRHRDRRTRPAGSGTRGSDAVLQAREIARAGQPRTCIRQICKYTKDHEWVRIDGAQAHVGITDYAQKQLGDVVYLELPDVGRTLNKGDVFGTIESVKAVSELYSPVSGEVVEVNTRLTEKPEAVNTDPHGSWMIVVKVTAPEETSELLDASKYMDLTK